MITFKTVQKNRSWTTVQYMKKGKEVVRRSLCGMGGGGGGGETEEVVEGKTERGRKEGKGSKTKERGGLRTRKSRKNGKKKHACSNE